MKRDIPKFDTVLLHSHWSSLRRKYLSKIPTDINVLSCGSKILKISGISDTISPALHLQKSKQRVRACAVGDGAICSKNRKIVPYHRDSLNTRNGARLRSPSPIMAPGHTQNPDIFFIREPFPPAINIGWALLANRHRRSFSSTEADIFQVSISQNFSHKVIFPKANGELKQYRQRRQGQHLVKTGILLFIL